MPAGVRGLICDGWWDRGAAVSGPPRPVELQAEWSRGRRWRRTAPRSTGPLKQPSRVFSGHAIRPIRSLLRFAPYRPQLRSRSCVSSCPERRFRSARRTCPADLTGSLAHVDFGHAKTPRRVQRGWGFWLRGQDLNLRPSGYEPDELPGCSTPRQFGPCRGPAGMRGGHRIREICVSFQVWR